MDDFQLELHRSLYAEYGSQAARQHRRTLEHVPELGMEAQSRFLVSKINLRSLTTIIISVLFFSAAALAYTSLRTNQELKRRFVYHSEHSMLRASLAKDAEVLINRILRMERDVFSKEIEKDREKKETDLEEAVQLLTEKFSAMEFSFRSTTSVDQINYLQSAFAEWKLQHEEWLNRVNSGDPDGVMAEYTEKIPEIETKILRASSLLSELANDYMRRDLNSATSAADRMMVSVSFASGLLLFAIFTLGWAIYNFLGALKEFLNWFRKQTWLLSTETEKLSRGEENLDLSKEFVEQSRHLNAHAHELRKVLARLMEAFSGEINGERLYRDRRVVEQKSPIVLKFEKGAEEMKALLTVENSTSEKPKAEQSETTTDAPKVIGM